MIRPNIEDYFNGIIDPMSFVEYEDYINALDKYIDYLEEQIKKV